MVSLMKINFFIFLTVLCFIQSCRWNPKDSGDPNLIVCTTTLIGDAVKQLVGNRHEVHTLMGAGVDPHTYEAKPSDVRALGNSRVIIYNGLHLEGKMTTLFERIGREKEVIAFSDGMDHKFLINVNAQTHDPHVWFDPDLWFQGIRYCAYKLIKVYPADREFILNNLRKIEADFDSLKNDLKTDLKKIPKENRVMITSHDAFHYFGRAFEVEVLALQGVSTVTEPGLKDVSNLVDLIVKRRIKAVFVESSVSPKSIKAVQEACKTKGHILRVGGTMYSDALGDYESGANTYLGMMRSNVRTLINGLN